MQVINIVVLEVKKEERTYRLELPVGAPLGEAYDVVQGFVEKMVFIINEHNEKSKTTCCEGTSDGKEEV